MVLKQRRELTENFMVFLDLAGNEPGDAIEEKTFINKSLYDLSQMLRASSNVKIKRFT